VATDSTRIDPLSLPWVRWSRMILWVTGGLYLLLGVGMVPLLALLLLADGSAAQEDVVGGIVGGLCAAVVGVFFGGVNFVAARGLARGDKWAWITTLIIGGIYAPSGCLPFGVALLYGMLQDDVREAFKT
jgi:hypothetical protein